MKLTTCVLDFHWDELAPIADEVDEMRWCLPVVFGAWRVTRFGAILVIFFDLTVLTRAPVAAAFAK